MRISTLTTALTLATAAGIAGCGPGYTSYGVTADFGTPVDVYGYEPDYWGDWRTNYSLWSPTVVYDYNGAYYPRQIRGSRPVEVYQYHNQYFMPPRDNAWVNTDKRFDYKHRPSGKDYQRARPRPGGRGPGGNP